MKHRNLSIILGPPGTGKTSSMVGLPPGAPNPTGLVGVVERELANGTQPDKIGYFAFTNKAADEAIERAGLKFGLDKDRLPYFRTIHSLCFRSIGLKSDQVITRKHYSELGDMMGLDLAPMSASDDWYGMDTGSRMLFLEGMARVTGKPLTQVHQDANEVDVDYWQLEQLAVSLDKYKRSRGLLDYTDMLKEFVRQGKSVAPELDVLIVDEAQDLSVPQWGVVAAIAAKAKRVYVAGDDDQAIYRWAGADVDTFMGLRGRTTVLGQSYRIPGAVHAMADSIVRRMGSRTPKQWKPRKEAGRVDWYVDHEQVDMSAGQWLCLVRNGYYMRRLEEYCRRNGYSYDSGGKDNPLESKALKAIITYTRLVKGIPAERLEVDQVLRYISPRHAGAGVRSGLRKHASDKPVTMTDMQKWGFPDNPPIWTVMLDRVPEQDREYFIAARRRGETLTGKPRIKISTIHAAKGGEADNVLLVTDMSQRTYREMERDPDSEHRVWYVAVTRTKTALHVIQPRTGNYYDL